MKRTIEFRVWIPEKEKMLYQSAHSLKDFLNRIESWGTKEPYDLLQWTGLVDKNKKKIYERDIIPVWTDQELTTNSIVTFENGCFVKKGKTYSYPISWQNTPENEVIGNIYENPEAIKDDQSGELTATESNSSEVEAVGEAVGPDSNSASSPDTAGQS